MANVCLITGSPGSGKTSLIKEVISCAQVRCGGFYTHELRDQRGVRKGFELVTLDGRTVPLALAGLSSHYKVSKYGVNIRGLEEVGVKAVQEAMKSADLIIIDEIGKMELLSPAFRGVVFDVLNSPKTLLGTIMLPPHPFADKVKAYPGAKILKLNRSNYHLILQEVLGWLRSLFNL